MEKIKYNQTCLVYLAVSNPLFIGSSTLVIFFPFLEFFFGFFYFLPCCFMKFNNRLFPSYDIVVLSKYWQYFQGYFFTKFCFNMVKNIFSKMTVKFLTCISKTKSFFLANHELDTRACAKQRNPSNVQIQNIGRLLIPLSH